MPKFARKRDANEAEIVRALEAAGAAVQRLGEAGVPDLLVGYRGELWLIEVKRPDAGIETRALHRGKSGDARGLTPCQARWWAWWRGKQPVIVQTPAEALAAIGGEVTP